MSDPSPAPRDKRPSRIAGFFRRKMSRKDIALILLGLSFVSMSAYAFREPISAAFARMRAGAQGGETVSVFDVVVDRDNRQGGSSPQPAVQTRPYPKPVDGLDVQLQEVNRRCLPRMARRRATSSGSGESS